MMSPEYILVTDSDFHSRIRARYTHDIESLTKLGFRHLCYYMEQLKPFSAVFQLPILLLMFLHREVLTIQSPLRIAPGFILLYHTDPPTIALPMGMGIKLYTGFTERSILITCSFSNAGVPSPSPYIRRIETTKGLDEAWRLHQSNVLDMESYGKVLVPQVFFNTYVDMSRREEETFK
jgi:hypothetical protein